MECYYLCIYETCCIILSCSYVTFVGIGVGTLVGFTMPRPPLHNMITIKNDNNVQCAMCYVHIMHMPHYVGSGILHIMSCGV